MFMFVYVYLLYRQRKYPTYRRKQKIKHMWFVVMWCVLWFNMWFCCIVVWCAALSCFVPCEFDVFRRAVILVTYRIVFVRV